MSRGLDLAEARRLVVEAAFNPVLERVPDQALREEIDEYIKGRLSHDYSVEFTYAEEKFQAVMTDDRTAKFLNVKKSLPSLKIERFTYERDLVIEYTVSMLAGFILVTYFKISILGLAVLGACIALYDFYAKGSDKGGKAVKQEVHPNGGI